MHLKTQTLGLKRFSKRIGKALRNGLLRLEFDPLQVSLFTNPHGEGNNKTQNLRTKAARGASFSETAVPLEFRRLYFSERETWEVAANGDFGCNVLPQFLVFKLSMKLNMGRIE